MFTLLVLLFLTVHALNLHTQLPGICDALFLCDVQDGGGIDVVL